MRGNFLSTDDTSNNWRERAFSFGCVFVCEIIRKWSRVVGRWLEGVAPLQRASNVGRQTSDKSDWKLRVGNSSSSHTTSYKNIITLIKRPGQRRQQQRAITTIPTCIHNNNKIVIFQGQSLNETKIFLRFFLHLNTSAREKMLKSNQKAKKKRKKSSESAEC